MAKHLFLLLTVFLLSGYLGMAQIPATGDSLLKGLRSGHPRLLATQEDFSRVAAERNTDPYVKSAFQQLYREGEEILNAAPSRYVIPDGLRLLATSRRVADRVSTLGFLYRVTGEKRFAKRAWEELEAASRFPDWNPKHFLDVGEMTFAFALGYDWLFDYCNAEQQQVIRSAIMDKGLSRALLAYEGLATHDKSWWTDVPHNWNQVCNGGIGTGALAIADEEPALAAFILKNVLQRLPLAMKHFAPDGAWNEGPGYWSYATRYNVFIISSLESRLGHDFGLSEMEGFSKTGLFPLYLNSPVNKSFNYADGGDGPIAAAQLFWFAKRFRLPEVARYLYRFKPADPFALLWYDADLIKSSGKLAPDSYFRMAEVVTMRSRWDDSLATYVAFKAGDNKANHSHLDLGSFVLDALGERWIMDLGADNYNIPAYFSSGRKGKRWVYYRTRAEGHNTLVVQPGAEPDQDPEAEAKVTQFSSRPEAAYGITDLTAAYAGRASSVKRGIALADHRRAVVVEDELAFTRPEEVYWFAHTRAEITLSADKRTAVLSRQGKKYAATLVYPAGAVFGIMPAVPLPSSPHPAENNPNRGLRKLSIHLSGVKQTRIVVIFHPADLHVSTGFSRPLEDWKR
ncbi:heparinase II/III domain-containing protein [Compostibacter hankyongensis]|uniref:Heparinase II/III-like C-terminal domain-containing protein n=1 Tax=Compostibacter hankyongensis TaxID=1007089 RepID=A0ABP8FNH3_9BACT